VGCTTPACGAFRNTRPRATGAAQGRQGRTLRADAGARSQAVHRPHLSHAQIGADTGVGGSSLGALVSLVAGLRLSAGLRQAGADVAVGVVGRAFDSAADRGVDAGARARESGSMRARRRGANPKHGGGGCAPACATLWRPRASASTSAPPTRRWRTPRSRPMPTHSRPPTCNCCPFRSWSTPAKCAKRDLLPSFLYLPGGVRFSGRHAGAAVGRRARFRGRPTGAEARRGERRPAGVLGQVVALAFGRGSHFASPAFPRAGRRPKISPVEASRRYLEHLREAWDARMPDAPFTQQQVLVTVPASFDAVARELTQEAAKQAGYRNITLLEEPQAAFYAWIERHPDWRERVQPGDLILVVDIGGGTTDFTLIASPSRRANWRWNAWRWASTSCWAATTSIWRWPAGGGAARAKGHARSIASRCRRCGTTAAPPRRSCSNPAITRANSRSPSSAKAPAWWAARSKPSLQRADIEKVLSDGFLPAGIEQRHARAPAPRRLAGDGPALRRRPGHHPPPGALPAPAGVHRRAWRRAPRPERPGLPHPRPVQRRRAECTPGARAHSERSIPGWPKKSCRR
jgi:hypothetical protein